VGVPVRDFIDPQIQADNRGRLTIVEFKNLPWVPQRAYFLSHSDPKSSRGSHAHKELHQFFISLRGHWTLRLFDGNEWTEIEIIESGAGLLIEPGLWREISTNSEDAVLGVFASQPYFESDYIRDIDEFIEWKAS